VPCKSSRWRRQLCSIVFSTNFWLTMLIPSVTDWNYKAAYIRICLVRWSFPKHRPTISMKPHVLLLVTLRLVTVCYPFIYAPQKRKRAHWSWNCFSSMQTLPVPWRSSNRSSMSFWTTSASCSLQGQSRSCDNTQLQVQLSWHCTLVTSIKYYPLWFPLYKNRHPVIPVSIFQFFD